MSEIISKFEANPVPLSGGDLVALAAERRAERESVIVAKNPESMADVVAKGWRVEVSHHPVGWAVSVIRNHPKWGVQCFGCSHKATREEAEAYIRQYANGKDSIAYDQPSPL